MTRSTRQGLGVPGIGSGFEANQRMAGVPAREAREAADFQGLAAQDPEKARRSLEDRLAKEEREAPPEAKPIKPKIEEKTSGPEEALAKDLADLRDRTLIPGDPIRDVKVRAKIEARLESLSLESYLFAGHAVQRVPIIPEKLEAEYVSLSGVQAMWISGSAQEYMKTHPNAADVEILNVLGMRRLASALRRLWVAGEPHFLDPDIDPTAELDYYDAAARAEFMRVVDERSRLIYRLGDVLIDLLLANHDWFQLRVRKLATLDLLAELGKS